MAPNTIKRSELYAHVWSYPIIQISTDFGIAGDRLREICINQSIPTPPAGYFMMDTTKQAVSRRDLPASKDDQLITISRNQKTPIEHSAHGLTDLLIPEIPDPQISEGIDAYLKLLRSDPWADERGIIQPRNYPRECLIKCSPAMIDVAANRFKLFLTALRANGCQIEFESSTHRGYSTPVVQVRLSYGCVKKDLRVEETATRRARPLSAREAKEKEKNEAQGRSFYISRPWIYTPKGKLQVVLGRYERRSLGNDVTNLVRIILKDLKEREAAEIHWEVNRRRKSAKKLLSLRKLRHKIWKERQLAAIEGEAKKWARAVRLRSYISRIEEVVSDSEVVDWLVMANQLADDLDPISSESFAKLVKFPKYDEVKIIAESRKAPYF